ncbi:hypothetical protein CB0101_04995 [Synechococcus sp. CB0101]|uniref:hypothetical protein n=1 Tax=Synechococcus sp. CB0101 TaxID=232348 RepID=UPI0002001B9B|nr:hypothetical protein [Synechococcus sp. CB0101]QCH14369.1 hypothetical protein CB0101_04995 [Synechococcus sp. CB0101]
MAKQNRFANQTAEVVEVAGRKLRTNDPAHLRKMVRRAEEQLAEDPQALDHLRDMRGGVWGAMRLKGLL